MELFRQFAVVKSVFIVRDWSTGASRGLAFLEFHTVEHAVFALQVRTISLQVVRMHDVNVGMCILCVWMFLFGWATMLCVVGLLLVVVFYFYRLNNHLCV